VVVLAVGDHLFQQKCIARIQELRDTPTVTVLDVATPPEIRSKPKRSMIVMASTGFAGVLALAWVAFSLRRASRA